MKSKFNIYNMNLMYKLQYSYIINIKNTYRKEYTGHNRSKLIDLPAIYSSELKTWILGR